jgi:hypothetical protein
VAQVRRFLRDPAPDKRQRLIDRLLDDPAGARHFAHVLGTALLPDTLGPDARTRAAFEAWLRQQLAANTPYDQLVRDVLVSRGAGEFYRARENKPENLAAATSRLFLGVKLECAQCHSHPFARWNREQFWGVAAFFSGLPQPRQPGVAGRPRPKSPGREITIPGTEKVVRARFLDGTEPAWADGTDPRGLLAAWVTAADNPYFARAAVNRVWAHFFGVGLVDPVDDLGGQDPPSHPELLDELARQFADHRFDLKFLLRTVAYSRAYQRTSRLTDPGQEEPRRFARMALKGLTAAQLFDSLAQATGYEDAGAEARRGPARVEYLTRFASSGGKSTEFRLSILQALALMNGKVVADATDLEESQTLAAVVDAPFLDTAGRIETLYLAALGRRPSPEEATRLVKYVEGGGSDGSRRKALADVFWTLLNSAEFILNH